MLQTIVDKGLTPSVSLAELDELGKQLRLANNSLYVNCWHLSDEESVAMWQLYSTEKGIAVRTTAQRLRESFLPTAREDVVISAVQYVSTVGFWKLLIEFLQHRDTISSDFARSSLGMMKRDSFAYEREVRAAFMSHGSGTGHLGAYLNVDVNILMGDIFISPKAPMWLGEVVRSALRQYGFPDIPVQRSDLFDSFEVITHRLLENADVLQKVKSAINLTAGNQV